MVIGMTRLANEELFVVVLTIELFILPSFFFSVSISQGDHANENIIKEEASLHLKRLQVLCTILTILNFQILLLCYAHIMRD